MLRSRSIETTRRQSPKPLSASHRQETMRELRNINTDESISKRRLIFDESWLDKFNRLTIYIVFSPLIFFPTIMFFNEKFTNPNDVAFFYLLAPPSVIFGLYIFYRNATEKNLRTIETHLDRQSIRKILLENAKKNQYEIYRKSNDCLIFNEAYSDSNSAYKKTRIFFFQDNHVLYTVIRDGFRLNLPILFSQLFLKYELTKMLTKANT